MLKCVQSERNQCLLNDASETGKESAALLLLMLPATRLATTLVMTFAAFAAGKF